MEESNIQDKEAKRKRRMKRIRIVLIVLALVILLTPVRFDRKDGGTKHYLALLYSVYDYNQAWLNFYRNTETNELRWSTLKGIEVGILGFKVYDGTWEDRPTGNEWEQISADEFYKLDYEQKNENGSK